MRASWFRARGLTLRRGLRQSLRADRGLGGRGLTWSVEAIEKVGIDSFGREEVVVSGSGITIPRSTFSITTIFFILPEQVLIMQFELRKETFDAAANHHHHAAPTAVPTQHRFNPYADNGGTVLAIAGADFCLVAGDTRQSSGYSINTRHAPKVFFILFNNS